MLAWFAFGVPAAYWPGIPEAVQVAKWAVIGASPILLLWLRPRWYVVHTFAAALLGWAACTAMWSPAPAESFDALCKMAFGFVLFVIGHETQDLRPVYIGAALGLVPSAILCAAQAAGYPIIADWLTPAGLFGTPNPMAEISALVLIGLASRSAWPLMPIAALTLIMAQARGAMLAVLAVVLMTRPRLALGLMFCVPVLLLLPGYRNLASPTSLTERVAIWRSAAQSVTPLGSGIGSFPVAMQGYTATTHKIVQHAHNDALELAVELGVPGIVLAAMLVLLIAGRAPNAERYVLAGLGVEAMFGFPLHMPGTVFVGAVVAGHAARGWAGLRLGELVGGAALQRRHA